ncbi:PorV/PorQ family protein [Acidiluteibacter ferrifornacis]|uniref:PorV/PorQ family protein n=1 Tax=Acidiluteibacter ferrifornacis TaxID=2692424 RepID=A0A6N9NJC1_9FLAO|nr:PorV/PorQ family protein [Acidiluteibacter ferrifornacis]MBR9831898.1 PorV/PorQ family protein [bacterium]NBG65287.1 PorV/PorQ family protein [Acidiluteibacter ferrifornacis]
MKKLTKIFSFTFLFLSVTAIAVAGNEDRAGEAGSPHLLINPWARSSGFGGANTTSMRGLEAVSMNVAGLAQIDRTEILFANTNYLSGTGIKINSFGLAQKVGESGVLGLTVAAMNFGDNDITTVELPSGGVGTFSPSYLNIGVSYSKTFSNSIYGGLTVKVINESLSTVKSTGVAIDAGVKYVTGKYDQIQFGITLRNVGPPMRYQGNGLSIRTSLPENETQRTLNQRSADYEIPSQIMIGLSYDFFLSGVDTIADKLTSMHRLTAAGNFTSNSFTRDQINIGVEYAFREMFMIRGGYVYEEEALDEDLTRTAFIGPAGGASIEVPLGKGGTTIGFDYSYRATRSFDGTHTIGVRLGL